MDSLRNYDESSNHSTSSQNSETSDHRSRREPKHPYGVVYFHTDEQIALENLGTLQIRLEDCVDGKEVTANWKNSGPHKATIIKVAKKEFELRDTLNKKLKELAEGKFILPGVDPIAVNTFNKQTPAAAGLKSIGQSKRGRPKGLSNAKRPSVDKDPYCLIDFLQPPVNSAPDVTKNGNEAVPSTSGEAGYMVHRPVPSNPLRRDIQVLATPTGTIVEKTTVTTTPASLVAQSAQHPAKSNTEQSVLRKRQDSSESSGTSPKVAKVLKKVELASNSGVYVTNWFLREIQSDTFFEQERLAAEALKQAEFANEPVPEALKPKKRKILTTFADRQFKKIIQHVMENDLLKYTHSGRRGAEAVDRNIIHTVAYYVRGNNVGPFSRIVSTLFLEAKRDFKQKSNYNTPEATAKREAAKARKANAKKDKAPSGNETPNQQLSNDTVSQPNSIQALTVTATIQPDTLAHPRPSSSQQQERPPQFHRAWDNDSTDPTLSALKTSAPGVIQSAMDLLYSGGSSIWQQ